MGNFLLPGAQIVKPGKRRLDGSVPVIAARMTQYGPKDLIQKLPHGVDDELKRLYYDTAVSGHRPAIAALTSFVPTSQILFGSDFPYRALGETTGSLTQLGLSAADLPAIGRENALGLLPGLSRGQSLPRKSGNRFSEKDMRPPKDLERIPIQSNRDVLWGQPASFFHHERGCRDTS
jgi:Amidohydrolase